MGDIRYVVTERGYDSLHRKVKDHNGLFGPPHTTAMNQIGQVGSTSARAAAPIGSTGKTVARIRPYVAKQPIPNKVRIVESARSRAGFGYPRVLEFSPFAQSRYRKGTNRYRLWMKRAIDRIHPLIDAAFKSAADGVERIWVS